MPGKEGTQQVRDSITVPSSLGNRERFYSYDLGFGVAEKDQSGEGLALFFSSATFMAKAGVRQLSIWVWRLWGYQFMNSFLNHEGV